MRDISKKLTIINTGERKDNTSGTSSAQAASYGGGGGGVTIGGGLYLPKAIWDNVFEIKTAESGEEYLFGKLPIALQYGLTMYGDATTLNIPSIYNGLPIDGTTIYWDNGVLKAKGGESGGGVADSVAWANITGKPTFASVATSGKYDDLIGKPTLLSSFTDDIVSGKYLPLSGGTLNGALSIKTDSRTALINARYNGKDYTNVIWHEHSNEAEGVSTVIYGSPLWNVVSLETHANTTCIYRQTSGKKYTIWDSGNDGSGSGLDADMLDGKHLSDMKIWGQSFDLNGRISGNMSNVGRMYDTYSNSIYDCGETWQAFGSGDKTSVLQGGTLQFKIGSTAKMYISSSGNVGVGIPSPTRTFQVNGIISSKHSSYNYEYYINPHANGFDIVSTGNYAPHYATNYAIYQGTPGAGSLVLYADSDKNVGIGTINPIGKLQINHSAYDNGLILRRTADTAGSSIRFYSNDTQLGFIGINGSKRIEIGVNSGDLRATIDASANMLVYGGITMYSDQRKKTILNHVELSLKQIADAPLIEHYYNSDDKKTTHVGSIAQYWYGLNDWFCKKDSEGFLTMEIQNAALASAISIARELDRYETKTDKAIKKLKKRICELEDEVERLKSA